VRIAAKVADFFFPSAFQIMTLQEIVWVTPPGRPDFVPIPRP